MHFSEKELTLQYQGFCQSKPLWINYLNKELQQFDFQKTCNTEFKVKINSKLRLGKLVEQFVFNEFSFDASIEILLQNIQIQDEKITIGELDCILLQNKKPVHLEIVYKFYLYDKSVGETEIEHWIGPNRKDSFIQKYCKLIDKQLPLLYNPKTAETLKEHNLDVNEIEQKVYFKAQLFPHLNELNDEFDLINNDCIEGFYIYKDELKDFKNCKFYIPTKHNWLAIPHVNVSWENFDNFSRAVSECLEEKYAPLCWLKKSNGIISKFFVVWW
ncbi:DUF1853 family protein [Tenacibaculum sp. MEBiC06402]|uniref:DUF1853 family protein n=1 Tax=unclassified Tenacibaculum TaxID=2635139 RepID=UPI003B9C3A63